MNKYERIINNLDIKIKILKINKPYANCPECCQKDIDDLQEIKTAMEELVEKIENLKYLLRVALINEEDFVPLNIIKDLFFIDLIEREKDYKLGLAPKNPIPYTRFCKISNEKAEILKEAFEIE